MGVIWVILSVFLHSAALATVFKSSYRVKLQDADSFADLQNTNFATLGKHVGNGMYSWQYPEEAVTNAELGRVQRPSSEVRHIHRKRDSIIYDAIYSFDEYSRRIAPISSPEKRDKFLILSGCSFTYGNGLNDDQTLNYFLGRELNDYYTFNYGVGATGANTTLAIIQSNRLNAEIPQKKGIFIYLYIDSHLDRTNGLLPSLGWLKHSPFYEKIDGEMVRKGSFASGRPFFTTLLILTKKIFELNGNPDIIFPSLNASHTQHLCDIVIRSQNDFLKQFPDSKFLVYFHPLGTTENRNLKECLTKNDVTYFVGKRHPSEGSIILSDGHPNQVGNELIAKDLKSIVRSINFN